jgi:hypothetical protein
MKEEGRREKGRWERNGHEEKERNREGKREE